MNAWTTAAKSTHTAKESEVLGIFRLGHSNVQVVLDWKETGGCFYCVPDEVSPPRIRVGCNYLDWYAVVNVLMHEALEFEFANMDVIHRPTGRSTHDSGDRLFVFNHQHFTEVVARVAEFCTLVIPQLRAKFEARKCSDQPS